MPILGSRPPAPGLQRVDNAWRKSTARRLDLHPDFAFPALFVLVLLAALLSIDETWLPPALRPRRPRRAGQSASKGVLSNDRRSPRKGVDMTPALGTFE